MLARQVVVLGAGWLGGAVARSLAADGAHVIAVRRTPQPPDPAGVRWCAGPLDRLDSLDLPSAVDAVVLAIAPSGLHDDYDSTYPPAARAALAFAERTGARALVYTSSTGVYGDTRGGSVTESSPRRGDGHGSEALIAAEDVLLDTGRPGTTVLRVAGLYGPGRDPRARYRDASRLPLRGTAWVNLVHRDDVAAAVQLAIASADGTRVFNCSGEALQAAELCRWLAVREGRSPDALAFTSDAPPPRGNRRIDASALRAAGWTPRLADLRDGFATFG